LKYKCKESITGAKWDKSHVQDRAAPCPLPRPRSWITEFNYACAVASHRGLKEGQPCVAGVRGKLCK